VVEGGAGAPAVVLEAGSGCDSGLWQEVQQRVARATASYSYDRAGHGSSDPAGPWSFEGWAADLESWVTELRVPPPYVLAGHSFGAHIVRAFAAAHPGEVTGMVLVDARHERWRELLPDAFHTRLRELSPYDTEQALQADEFVRGLPRPERVPVTVITHGRADWIPEEFGLGPRDRNRCEQAWQEMQRDLAAQFPGAVVRVAADSGHLIPAEQPDLVAAGVPGLRVLGRLRGGAPR